MPSPRRNAAVVIAWVGYFVLASACAESDRPPTIMSALDSVDQVVFGMVHNLTADGVLRARLEADSAYFYDATQEWELFGVEVTFFSGVGEPTSTLTSERGTYELRSGDMQARVNVVGVTPDGRRLTTSVLNYQKTTNQLVGPDPFVFDEPGRHLEGQSFTSDPDFTNVRATNVRGTPGQMDVRN